MTEFIARHIEITGRFAVADRIERVFEMFSTPGKRAPVPGWSRNAASPPAKARPRLPLPAASSGCPPRATRRSPP